MKMTDPGDLKEQKCVLHKNGMNAHEFEWSTLMAASERSRAKDVFEGVNESGTRRQHSSHFKRRASFVDGLKCGEVEGRKQWGPC